MNTHELDHIELGWSAAEALKAPFFVQVTRIYHSIVDATGGWGAALERRTPNRITEPGWPWPYIPKEKVDVVPSES